ncbi:MAG: Unknown protein [uncultured Thiotrichaceae bacterium]|uniref:DUF692 domain-containing protein n=1 Tax=uncultured Thiotrichaceae bacterium TaxID=298394 RepID=A0A6S6S3X5_9GAMM|nr:MAG: Unknown protein [uncultured Thiotrichaceae bacterium]
MQAELPAGIGLGFRFQHANTILQNKPDTPWFELIADDLLLASGRQRVVDKLREHYPIALHAVGLNIAGPDPLDKDYLAALGAVCKQTGAAWLSDHLCWSAAGQRQHFDLLPFPFTKAMLHYLSPRIDQVQQVLQRPLVLENISYYQRFQQDEMGEWDFTTELMQRTGCQMLLDLNNLWTNATNFELDPAAELAILHNVIKADDIVQIHVAGSKYHVSADETDEGYWVDTHGEQVPAAVSALLRATYEACGDIPTIIERDNNLPEFAELESERQALVDTVNEY